MTLEIKLSGTGTANCDFEGKSLGVVGSKQPTFALARRLIDQGVDPKARTRVTREGRDVFIPARLESFAAWAVSEGVATSAKVVPYKAFPEDLRG